MRTVQGKQDLGEQPRAQRRQRRDNKFQHPRGLSSGGKRSTALSRFNAVGALIWSVSIGTLGWVMGNAAQALLARARHLEVELALAGLLLLAASGAWRWWRNR